MPKSTKNILRTIFKRFKKKPETSAYPAKGSLTHQKLMEILRSYGYNFTEKGLCAGFAVMGMSAFLSEGKKGIEEFKARLQYMQDHPDLYETASGLQKKIQTQGYSSLTEEEKKLYENYINIRAFLDGVMLYQKPGQHAELFNENLSQGNVIEASEVIQSLALEKKGGLELIDNSTIVCNTELFTNYIEQLSTLLKNNNRNITFYVETDFHRISVCYDHEQDAWTIIDANLPENINYTSASYPNWIANQICSRAAAYSTPFDPPKDKLFILSLNACSTKNEAKEVKEIFENFKKSDVYTNITQETLNNVSFRFNRQGTRSYNALMLALKTDDNQFINKFNKEKLKKVLRKTYGSKTYFGFDTAAEEYSDKVIDKLIQLKVADVNQRIKSGPHLGKTLAHVAAAGNHIDLLRVIEKHQGDFNKKFYSIFNFGSSALDIAKKHKRIEAIAFIESVLKRDQLLSKLDKLKASVDHDQLNNIRENIINDWKKNDKNNTHKNFDSEQKFDQAINQLEKPSKDSIKHSFRQ